MTTQSADIVVYEGEEYELLGSNFSQQLLDTFGMKPIMISTACYRGYVIRYAIEHDFVYLTYLYVHDENKSYPLVGGMMPKLDNGACGLYEHLHERLLITGFMVIGNNLVSLYPAVRRPHDYRTIFRLEFDEGKQCLAEDLSVKAALIRQQLNEIDKEREYIEDRGQSLRHRREEMLTLYDLSFKLAHGTNGADDN